ncbi:MAG: SDR family NAD(P)-dependent oxidoreductase, partial [Pseudomonadales bacterium]|nr:SDR family NAD(P)-dependent oxidoreductase [Pseudomonadales bacterium]
DAVQKLDISLCDEQGRVCVEFKGFSSRVLERANAIGTLILKPVWKNNGIDAELLAADSSSATYHEQHIFLCGLAQSSEALEQQAYFSGSDTKTAFFDLDITQINIGRSFKEISLALFEAMQKILWSKPKEAVLIQVLVPTYGQGQVLNALSGLLKTAQLENSKIVGQVIAVSKDESVDSLLEKLQVNRRYPQDQEIRYVGGERQVASFEEVLRDKAADSDQESMPEMPWREEGVYLITGGLGGLGLIFAEEILEKTPSARLILTGRSALKEEKALRLQGLESRGLKVEYHAVDVSDKEAVEILVQGIEKRWGGLHGIIHSAGIIKDKYLIKKNAIEFAEVMSPKVAGVINLDRASQTLGLDFFVVFSSGAGVMGNLGQGDYATANAFLDAFSVYRKDLEGAKERNGLSLSINWPLWKEGGMVVDEASARFMKDSLGLVPMETRRGLEAFYRGLDSCEPQVWVMEGEVKRLKRTLLARTKKSTESAIAASTLLPINSEPGFEVDLGTLLQKVQHMLKGMVASLLKLKIEDLDLDDDLSDYGFDSISLTEFANQMNQKYSLELTPTVFFENPTLEGFSEYLIEEYQEVFAKQFDVQTPTPTPTPTQTQTQTPTPTPIHAKPKTKEPKLEIVKTRHRSRSVKPIERPVTEAKSMGTMATDRIAIVGMSGRFPMARDINEFWENLQEGKDCIEEIPKDRWDWEEYFGDPTKEANKTNIKWGGFIEGVGDFDPVFFKINPSDAVLMDPQQRLMMSFIWLALEDAGYSASSLSGSNTGIFVGTTDTGYSSLIANSKKEIEASSAAAVVPSLGPNRMSYFLNFHGPSEPIETACSSSLVAMHRAITAMRVGDCEQSIVGGVNTLLSPAGYVAFGKMGVLSEDGRCKTFSAQANGYVRGEGVGMLVLKPLSIAEQNGDHIYGVILGSSQNHGGRANSLTAPNPKAQAELLVKAYQRAEVDPRTVSYIEAHGTGTALGDTIEIDALKTAFKKLNEIFREDGKDSKGSPVDIPHCALGSVKSNIGHLELSGGVAGLIKVLLQFKHKKIVQSLHCDEINPYIELKGSPFYTVNKAQKWNALKDSKGRLIPRRAGVSAFGFGGVNAHIILEEYIDKRNTSNVEIGTPHLVLIPLSAKNPRCLKVYAQKMLDFITRDVEQDGDIDLADLAYTLQVGREPMDARLGLIVDSKQMMIEKLRGYIEGHSYVADLYQGEVAKNKDTISVFASDEDLDDVVGVWIAKRKYDKLLGLWVKGLKFDWQQICQDDSKPRRISLPTYPFEQNRYWIGGDAHYEAAGKPLDPTSSLENVNVIENTVQRRRWEFSLPNNNDDSNHYYTLSIEEKANLLLQQLIADQLQLTVGELDVSKAFSELAMTSIGMVKVAQGIRSKVSLNFQPASMYEKTNISDLSNYLCQDYSEELDALKVRKAKCGDIAKRSLPNSKLNFPELIKLNEIDDGRPVFWFHAGLGGVATYHSVAMESQRPFYGVQAKGYQTDELPLLGIEAMSAYYVEIIKSVQSEGPYDLGGYSMGGAISYEVARQLQELGQVVSTITMLDTPDFSSLNLLNKVDQPGLDRTGLLRSFNGVLMQGLMTDPMAGMSLIHRDELNTELDYESFLKQMIMLAISKGCNTSEEELTKRVTQVNAVEAGYRLPLDSSRPLLNPGEVICYYFKNKSGQFLGEMAPYLSIDNKEEAMDGRNYWKGWENSVTNFQLMDVDSSSHMMLLTENTAKDTIIDFCKNLYRDVAVTA